MATSTRPRTLYPTAVTGLAAAGLLMSVSFSYVPRGGALFGVLCTASALSALVGVACLILCTRGRPQPTPAPSSALPALPAGPRRRALESHVRAEPTGQLALPAGRR